MKLGRAEKNLKERLSICADHNKLGREKVNRCKKPTLAKEEIKTSL